MDLYLGKTEKMLSEQFAIHTGREIQWQPRLWKETCDCLLGNGQIGRFLEPLWVKENLEIILTGAGSSAFIGQSVEHAFRGRTGKQVRSLPTTTLTTHFDAYIGGDHPLLLISFARSGNSPESLAVLELAESKQRPVYHMAVTCNKKGKLAKRVGGMAHGLSVLLPEETEDKALAMTTSFTSMLLAALLIADYTEMDVHQPAVNRVSEMAAALIEKYTGLLEEIASVEFLKIVFLGSGPRLGVARESHLKVQELTDGRVTGKYDSFLGFRHGPKVIAREHTLLVYLFSAENATFRYEKDLAEEVIGEKMPVKTAGVFYSREQARQIDLDFKIVLPEIVGKINKDFLLPVYVIPAQILGFFKSLQLGLSPDSPSEKGAISRVVKPFDIFMEGDN